MRKCSGKNIITLRNLRLDDLNFLLEVRNDDLTRKFLENNSMFTYEECEKWFNENKPKWFIIEINQKSIGYIRTNGNEVGCDIHPNFRRMGYAKQAYKIYLSDKTYADLWVFEDNFAKKLYEDLGFLETGKTKLVRGKNYIHMEYKNTNYNDENINSKITNKIFIGGFGGTGSRVLTEIFEKFGFYVGRDTTTESLDFCRGQFPIVFDRCWIRKNFDELISYIKLNLQNNHKFVIKHGHFMFINNILRDNFHGCKTIYIMRHPIDMAVKEQYIPHKKYGNIKDVNNLDAKIKYYIKESIRACNDADLVIKYEDLCFDLENQLKIIRDFIGDPNLKLPDIDIKPSKTIGKEKDLYDKYDVSMLGY
jgi:ribosomal protein S18 acetylase RimI-like enzyme